MNKNLKEAKLTKSLACKILADLPYTNLNGGAVDFAKIHFDADAAKYFTYNEHNRLYAWSCTLQKWILWLHPKTTDPTFIWSIDSIREKAE